MNNAAEPTPSAKPEAEPPGDPPPATVVTVLATHRPGVCDGDGDGNGDGRGDGEGDGDGDGNGDGDGDGKGDGEGEKDDDGEGDADADADADADGDGDGDGVEDSLPMADRVAANADEDRVGDGDGDGDLDISAEFTHTVRIVEPPETKRMLALCANATPSKPLGKPKKAFVPTPSIFTGGPPYDGLITLPATGITVCGDVI